MYKQLITSQVRSKIREFLAEDIGTGDICSAAIFGTTTVGAGGAGVAHGNDSGKQVGRFVAKSAGVVAGLEIGQIVYDELGGSLGLQASFTPLVQNGDHIQAGQEIATARGDVCVLLGAERVILNLLQRMSGIATATHQAIQTLGDSTIRVCDTRKTAPGLRLFDKAAVRAGGGYNHRFGLYDTAMIKDNHIAYAGGITEAVEKVRQFCGHTVKIEVETTSDSQVIEAINAGADIIMFDNCTPSEVRQMATLVPDHIITECSGNVSIENIATYANTGVDYISLGFLTHSAPCLDISFKG
jgi:nicotinate-nucleotide pyrophosphorylase (carboxylating)